MTGLGPAGIGLLALGPLAALNTPGAIDLRVIGGGFFTCYGGLGIGMATGVLTLYRRDWAPSGRIALRLHFLH